MTGVIPQDANSYLALFVQTFLTDGRAIVSAQPLDEQDTAAIGVLKEVYGQASAQLAFDPPAFSDAAALWAARLFYHLCQFTVCRDIGEERVVAACSLPCPTPRGPETDWSADLMLRHLPRLFQFARHLSNADPLVAQMKQIAVAWPLSSVGIDGLENLQLDSFIGHPALCRHYADRVIAGSDNSRLGDGRLDDVLRADLGIHRELAPTIAAKLFTTHDTH